MSLCSHRCQLSPISVVEKMSGAGPLRLEVTMIGLLECCGMSNLYLDLLGPVTFVSASPGHNFV